MGLRQKLNEAIKQEGYLSLQQVYKLAESLNHKQRTAERELNPSHSPNVMTVKNEKNHIVGYKYIDPSTYIPPEPDKRKRVVE
jgi:hypothetical protein